VTKEVLPVLAHDGWQVETVWVDLGDDGLREVIEVRHGKALYRCTSCEELRDLLNRENLNWADFMEIDAEDGCE